MNSKSMVLCSILLVFVGCAPSGGDHKEVAVDAAQGGEQVGQMGGAVPGYDDVKPVFEKHCAACHPAKSAPNWLDYTQAKTYADNGKLMSRFVQQKSMPPAGSPQAQEVSDQERQLVAQWIQGGAPQQAIAATPGSTGVGGASGPAVSGQGSQDVQAPAWVQSCVGCHDQPSDSKTPWLAGQSKDYIVRQLQDFRWLRRIDPSNTMNAQAINLDEETMVKIAEYFEQMDSPWTTIAKKDLDKELFDTGEALAKENCNSCHFNPFHGDHPAVDLVPELAGQSKNYIVNQLLYFAKGLRQNDMMKSLSEKLTDQQIEALAEYYSSLSTSTPEKQKEKPLF